MTEAQVLAFALATAPTVITVLVGILINNARMTDMNSRTADLNVRIGEMHGHMDARFTHMDARFDDMRDTWRSELHRVEEVLDARLKHIEER
jgi:hypothetical protein